MGGWVGGGKTKKERVKDLRLCNDSWFRLTHHLWLYSSNIQFTMTYLLALSNMSGSMCGVCVCTVQPRHNLTRT